MKSEFTIDDVRKALDSVHKTPRDFMALLSPAAEHLLETMAAHAQKMTAQYFGNAIKLFTPLYIANYCVNECVYCGFNRENSIHRGKLTLGEITAELHAIAETGLDEVLLLTGDSRTESDVEYIAQAVRQAAKIFSTVGLEVYPMDIDEYTYLHKCGADFVSVYQETYDRSLYEKVHPAGPKRDFDYRVGAQERAILAGMRGVGFGALLGLGGFHADAYAAGIHAYELQRKYPHAEISMSVPRLMQNKVGERQTLQAMLAYRLFMPYAGITISTRERAGFRDNVIGMCATKISAGVSVGVGGHVEKKGDDQFVVSDPRSVDEIRRSIENRGLSPVFTDHIFV